MTALVPLPDLSGDIPDTVPRPEPLPIVRVPVATLRINPAYQRGVGRKSLAAIRAMVTDFSWVRFGVISVADGPDGLEVIDGQHRAIAARALGLPTVPAVRVPKRDDAEAAAHFVGINTARTAVSAIQRHRAAITAGDADAIALRDAVLDAGAEIVSARPADGYRAGQTMAMAALTSLRDQHGTPTLVRVLRILTRAGRAPVRARDLRVVGALLTDPLYRGAFADEDLERALAATPEARLNALAAAEEEATGQTRQAAQVIVLFRLVRDLAAPPAPASAPTPKPKPNPKPKPRPAGDALPEADQRVFDALDKMAVPGSEGRLASFGAEIFARHVGLSEGALSDTLHRLSKAGRLRKGRTGWWVL